MDVVVEMLVRAEEAWPGARVGEMRAGPLMSLYDGPSGREVGVIDYRTRQIRLRETASGGAGS